MSRPALIVALLAAAALAGVAPAHAADTPRDTVLYEDGHVGRQLLGGDWLLRLDPEDQGLAQGFQNQVTTDGWRTVTVPNAWNAGDDSPESQRGTVAWYRKDFQLAEGRRSGSFRFRFESVNYRATVWLNGRLVGSHEGAYVPFEVPARAISRTGVNRLVVRVDSRRSDTDVPPMRESEVTGLPGGGWWNYGGLLREVYLRRYDRVDLEQLHVRPELACARCDARVLITARLRNDPGGRRKARLRVSIGGRRVESRPVSLPSGRTREVTEAVTIENPRLWSTSRPALYGVRAEVTASGRTLSAQRTHVGIRRIEVDENGRVLLNGRRIVFRGASLHEDHPQLGAALTPGVRRRIFADLLRLNANVTRAHYPLHPHFLELADRHGVMVWDQIPVYRMRETLLAQRSVRAKGLDHVEAMVRRDWNHPSVLAWSIGNELARDVEPGQERYIRDALARIERLDGTRLSAIDVAGYPSVRLRPIYRLFDALGVNSYFGWYPGPVGSVLNREVLGPYLDQLHAYYRRQALFVTEFGAEANRDGPVDEKGSFAFQTELLRYHLSVYDSRPFVNGAIAWVLQDFKVRPGWDGYNRKPSPPFNKKGLVDEGFGRKPAFEVVARAFRRAITRGARRSRPARFLGEMQMAPIGHIAQSEAFQPDRVRLLAIFRTLGLGDGAYLSGQFRHLDDPDAEVEPYADRRLVLEEAPWPHTAWTAVAETTSDQEGYFSFTRRPVLHTRYRVRSVDPPQVLSEEPIVRVRLDADLTVNRERVKKGRSVTFSGSAAPAHDGMTVLIQRKDERGRWATLTRTFLRTGVGGRSVFEKRVRLRRGGEFRVRLPGDADHLPGMSAAVEVVVVERKRGRRSV